MPGPLPKGEAARRRNPPTIAATALPSEGRTQRPPTVPKTYKLGKAGAAWWRWAWKLPQATRWDTGSVYFVARRAQLEDDLANRETAPELAGQLGELLEGADPDAIKRVEAALAALSRVAAGTTTLMREMRELDNRLGLNPKAMAELRWEVTNQQPEVAGPGVARMDDYRDRLG